RQGERIVEVLWVLDQPDDLEGPVSVGPGVADLQTEDGGHPAGEGHFARVGRQPSGEEPDGRVGGAGVLGPQVDGGDRAGDGHPLVVDDLAGPEGGGDGGEVVVQSGIVAGEADGGAGVGWRAGSQGQPADGGSYRDGHKSQKQRLLAPLTSEQACRPPNDGATCRGATVPPSPVRDGIGDRSRHRAGSETSSDSGGGGGAV